MDRISAEKQRGWVERVTRVMKRAMFAKHRTGRLALASRFRDPLKRVDRWVVFALLLASTFVRAEDLTISLPKGAQVASARADNAPMKLSATGTVQDQTVRFTKLLPSTVYDIAITLKDGTILQGVNLGWLNEEPVDATAQPMTDEDRKEVTGLVQPDKDFFNKIEILQLTGDHNRATALVRMIRDRAFHSDKGGEVISRFEIWYFRFEYGGWEKVQQGQKILRRDRFKSQADYEKTIGPIRWTPELGGIKLEKGKDRAITLAALPGDTPAASTSSPPSATQPAP